MSCHDKNDSSSKVPKKNAFLQNRGGEEVEGTFNTRIEIIEI